MLRKISNYLAVIALCLSVGGTSALADSTKGKTEYKKVFVNDSKDFNFYNEFIRGGGKHSYTVKVEAGKEVKIKIHSSKNIALNIQSPSGQTRTNSAERYFEVKLNAEGEYTIELEAIYLSQYSMEVSTR